MPSFKVKRNEKKEMIFDFDVLKYKLNLSSKQSCFNSLFNEFFEIRNFGQFIFKFIATGYVIQIRLHSYHFTI